MASKPAPQIAVPVPPPTVEKLRSDLPLPAGLTTIPSSGFPPEALHLLHNGPPMYLASLDGRLTYTNQQYRRLQRIMAEKRAGLLPTDGVPAFPITEIIREIAASGCTVRREDVIESTAETEFFSSHHFPVRDDRGSMIAIGGVYQNATREAHAWTETMAARDRFRDVARLVLDWIWETDSTFNFVYVSPRIMDLLKLHPRHLQGTSLFTLGRFTAAGVTADGKIPDLETCGAKPAPLPAPDMRSSFRDALFEIAGTDGEIRMFLMSGLPMFDERTGAFKGYRGTARDITAEMDMRRTAEQSQRRLADTLENVSEGLALRDSRARLNLCNSRFRDVFRTIADAVTIKTPFAHILAAARDAGLVAGPKEEFEQWIAQSAPGCRLSAPLEIHLSDGRWLKITESRSTKGGVLTMLSDITDIKCREEALISAKLEAERASHSKGAFLANMSHELRTPLNAIMGFSEIMLTQTFGPLGSNRYLEYIKDIHDSSRHLLGVINDILDISKSEAGKLQLNEEDVDLIGEIRAAARLFTEQAIEGRIALKLDLPKTLPRVWADARKIKQVMLNLISNAIKFTPAGGSVSVRLFQDEVKGDVMVAVADTGIGIEEGDIEKVFSAFGQVENSLSRRHEGTGLGLPLTLALVEIHGGQIQLQSKVGAGTTVTVRLPASRLRI
jgi:signal transduction histidine kinase